MKLTNIFKLAVVSSILVFAVGCGKDKNVSGGYMNFNPLNPGQGTDIVDANAIAGYNNLLQWRNNLASNPQQERGILARGIGFSKGDFSNSNSGSGNVSIPEGCDPIKVFGVTIGYYCKGSSQTVTNPIKADLLTLSKCTRTQQVNNGQYQLITANAANLSATGCTPSGGETVYNIGSNDELNQLLSGAKGKILSVSGTSLITIYVGPKGNFYSQPTHVYQIDTSIHSIYNPVASQELSTGKVNKLFQAF